MKKRGFTLIELLAVIVILAIIALIATPIILGIINDARKESKIRTAELIAKEVELAYTSYLFEHTETEDDFCIYMDKSKSYFSMDNGEIVENCSNNTVGVKSGKDTYKVTYTDGMIKVLYGEEEYAQVKLKENGSNNEIAICKFESEGSPSQAGQIGAKYKCDVIPDKEEKFYFYLLNDSAPYNLIMERSLGYKAWSSDGKNHKDESEDNQAVTAKAYLAERTSTWTNVDSITLPTKDQIQNAYTDVMPTWLYGNLAGTHGYWTATPAANDTRVWCVVFNGVGELSSYGAKLDSAVGVRPVITVPNLD